MIGIEAALTLLSPLQNRIGILRALLEQFRIKKLLCQSQQQPLDGHPALQERDTGDTAGPRGWGPARDP